MIILFITFEWICKRFFYRYRPCCEQAFIYVYVTGAVLLKDRNWTILYLYYTASDTMTCIVS